MKEIYIILCFQVLFLSCKSQEVQEVIKPNIKECESDSLLNSYFQIDGISVSYYYDLIDSIKISKTKGVYVLSPRRQQNDSFFVCEEVIGGRLLVIVDNHHIDVVNDSAVMNNVDYQSDPFEKIKRIDNGFVLEFEFGSIIYCRYTFEFIINEKEDFILNEKTLNCFNKGNPSINKTERTKLLDKNISIKEFNVNNYIDIPNLIENRD